MYDWEDTNNRIQNLFCIVTEDEPEAYGLFSDWEGPYSLTMIWEAFDLAGIRVSIALDEDVTNALNGYPLKYFRHSNELVEEFRSAHGAWPAETGTRGFISLGDAAEEALAILEERRANPNHSLYAAAGYACPEEQKVFYDSDLWANRAKAVRAVARGCRCGRRDIELHAHHDEPIYSAYSRLFYRNFELNRIRVLCKICHHRMHQRLTKTMHGFSTTLDGPDWIEARRVHDAHPEECPWCSSRGLQDPVRYRKQGFDFNASDRLPF